MISLRQVVQIVPVLGLLACSGTISKFQDAQLKRQAPESYSQLVKDFVDECVTGKRTQSKPAANRNYRIDHNELSCHLSVNTYYDDDTEIANLLTRELKRADPRFNRLPNGLIGAGWRIGTGTRWNVQDGTPLIALGRRSSETPLRISRHGAALPG